MRPNRDKVTGRERNLQGSSSSHGAAPGAQYIPLGATGLRKETGKQLFPSRLSRGPSMSLSSLCLTVLGLSINFWKYIVIRPPWKSPSLFGNARDCSGSGHDHKHQVRREKATGIVWLLA